jgi:outer membrane protein OmpA-like peptidoglycan-associated protein
VLYFDMGSSELRPGASRKLFRLVKALKGRAGLSLLVEGHTDDTGTEELNERLGARRARTVAGYLERRLGAGARLEQRSFGSSRPADSGRSPAARALNRRVEIKMNEGEL